MKCYTLMVLGTLLLIIPVSAAVKPYVKLETNEGDIVIELYENDAPNTVANFLNYVNSGFYDGLIYHRVIENFMIQAGAYDAFLYDADFSGSFDPFDEAFYHVPNDPIELETDADLENVRGTVAMARTTDPDSATSQFFINHKDNPHLDPNGTNDGYAVFGEVTEDSLDVVDTIAEVDIWDNANVKLYFEALPIESQRVTIGRAGVVLPEFGDDSADLSDVSYIMARPGDMRVFHGQDGLEDCSYRVVYSQETLLGVPCLKIEQASAQDCNQPDSILYVARSIENDLWTDDLWVFKEVQDANTLFEAEELNQITPFSEYPLILTRLASDNFDDDTIINREIDDTIVTSEIIRLDVSIDELDDPNDDLVQVKRTFGPTDVNPDWSYYHESVGLVLDLWDGSLEEDQIDYAGDGWVLGEVEEMDDVFVKVRADKDRDNPMDKFDVRGDHELTKDDFDKGDLYLRVTPWQITIDTSGLESGGFIDEDTFEYNSPPEDVSDISIKIDLSKGTFEAFGKDVDLTGMDEPVRVDLVVGNYHAAAEAELKGQNNIPILLLRGEKNVLRKKTYRHINKSVGNDSVKVKGEIATFGYPLDLTTMDITVTWGDTSPDSYTLSGGEMKKANNKQKYTNIVTAGGLKQAVFDMEKGTFDIYIKESGLSTEIPKILTIQIDEITELKDVKNEVVTTITETLFDEELTVRFF
ncbi:MAG: peptidylprolyl isomerase [Sedimentisphaerales bacterium]|nr:peptidylprolyl isomerase [Sedimentisphaerales bacterium]